MAGIRTEIARWTREGASLALIEERIGGLPESEDDAEDDKSALWLWAWSYRHSRGVADGDSRRRVLAD
jgi:hypothetical protein